MLWLTTEDLPTSVTNANGDIYEIASDFRTWMRVDCVLRDKEIPNEARMPTVATMVGIDFISYLEDPVGISKALIEFYMCGKESKDDTGHTNGKRAYNFMYDMDILYASFRQQYGLNILKEKMHWFEFKALFESLNENTAMAKAIKYRTMDTSELKGKDLENARKLEKYWRLPEEKDASEKTPEELEAEVLARCYGGTE